MEAQRCVVQICPTKHSVLKYLTYKSTGVPHLQEDAPPPEKLAISSFDSTQEYLDFVALVL